MMDDYAGDCELAYNAHKQIEALSGIIASFPEIEKSACNAETYQAYCTLTWIETLLEQTL